MIYTLFFYLFPNHQFFLPTCRLCNVRRHIFFGEKVWRCAAYCVPLRHHHLVVLSIFQITFKHFKELRFCPRPQIGDFFIVSREKSCKKFLFYVKHHYLCG